MLHILASAAMAAGCAGPSLQASSSAAPVVSAEALEDAYKVQDRLVTDRLANAPSDGIAGYKGGMTNPAAMKALGLSGPLYGVLFRAGDVDAPHVIHKSKFGMLFIETEIGFVIKATVRRKLTSLTAVQNAVEAILPVIELPDVQPNNAKPDPTAVSSLPKAPVMVARNIASSHFIRGNAAAPAGQDLGDVVVTLYRNGEVINRGNSRDALERIDIQDSQEARCLIHGAPC